MKNSIVNVLNSLFEIRSTHNHKKAEKEIEIKNNDIREKLDSHHLFTMNPKQYWAGPHFYFNNHKWN